MEKILILDFGSQTTALIARRVREIGVYTEIVPGGAPLTEAALEGACGVILSGSPESVYDKGAALDKRVYQLTNAAGCALPLLGICYGLQRVITDWGGLVAPLSRAEYGKIGVTISDKADALQKADAPHPAAQAFLSGFTRRRFNAWMSHGDTLARLPPGFAEYGKSDSGFPAVIIHTEKPWFGVQFHPEVSHCEQGGEILTAFAFGVCGCKKTWTMERYLEEAAAELREKAGSRQTLLLISGGVDSSVAGAMLLKTLDAGNVYLMYIDTGLMRENETAEVASALRKLGARHLSIVDAGDEFLAALAGITEPEKKRAVIGDLFITVQEREVRKLGLAGDYLLAQGTLYTDMIESGKGVGSAARLIKSHHNVGSPLVAAKREAGLILEPLCRLYKDEARAAGRLLGLGEEVIMRHPFPGPGLAVRMPGEVTKEKCAILRAADKVFIDELKRRKTPDGSGSLYNAIWQAFAVLLPVRSVGVAGDGRKYGYVLALRAVCSADGMTADAYPFEAKDLLEIATAITNAAPEIGRVCYDISSKPPATIEWE